MDDESLLAAIATHIQNRITPQDMAEALAKHRLLNAKESAEFLGVSRTTFYRIRDQINAVVLDEGTVRYRMSDLHKFQDEKIARPFL